MSNKEINYKVRGLDGRLRTIRAHSSQMQELCEMGLATPALPRRSGWRNIYPAEDPFVEGKYRFEPDSSDGEGWEEKLEEAYRNKLKGKVDGNLRDAGRNWR